MNKEDFYKYLHITYEDYKENIKYILNKEIIKMLETLGNNDEMPNILFYGNSGVGKKTMVNILLEIMFGDEIYNLKSEMSKIDSAGGKTNTVMIMKSFYHMIIEPNNNFDRYIIKDVVKKYVRQYVDMSIENMKKIKVVQINNLDLLSEYAQYSLRRTIENYSDTCRFVCFCNSLSKVAEPLRSRCLCIHIPCIQDYKMLKLINNICLNEKIELDENIKNEIIMKSNGNLKECIWKIYYYNKNKHFNTIYEIGIVKLVKEIKNRGDIEMLRTIIYDLTMNDIEEIKILHEVLKRILKSELDEEIKIKIINFVVENENKINKSRREIKPMEYIMVGINNEIQIK